jgi:hypothetical protein
VGLVEQAADQGRLSVVDRSAQQKPEKASVLVRFQVGQNLRCVGRRLASKPRLGDQKYPSFFFFSIDAAAS